MLFLWRSVNNFLLFGGHGRKKKAIFFWVIITIPKSRSSITAIFRHFPRRQAWSKALRSPPSVFDASTLLLISRYCSDSLLLNGQTLEFMVMDVFGSACVLSIVV